MGGPLPPPPNARRLTPRWARLPARRPGLVLALGLALAALGAWAARDLRIDADLARLLPPEYPSVQALDGLRREVGGESDVAVVVRSPSRAANRAFAEALLPRALALRDPRTGEPRFTRADYRREVDFLRRHALYFATDAELDSLETHLRREARAARQAANPFYVDLDEADGPAEGGGTEGGSADALAQAYRRLVGRPYPESDDGRTLVLRLYPGGAQTDLAFVRETYAALDALVRAVGPGRYDAAMEVTLAGRLRRQLAEVDAITGSIRGTFGLGVAGVLLIVVLYFGRAGYRARRSSPSLSSAR